VFYEACKNANVWCEEINIKDFLQEEPNSNRYAKRVFKVKDGYVDPFLLTYYNAYDAVNHGAIIKTYSKVENLIVKNGSVIGVKYFDLLNKKREEVYGKVIINATGPWASGLEKELTLLEPLRIAPTMGTLLVIKDRLVNHLINRLNKPGDGDIVVPSHNSIILGTTSKLVKLEDLDTLLPEKDEIEYLLKLGENLIPTIRKHRLIRFYSGARPLVASGGPLREVSRKFDIIDYEKEGYPGFITIFGGKLTTYRLMAEKTCDLVCEKLDIEAKCETANLPIPGGESKVKKRVFQDELNVDSKTAFNMQFKWGTFYKEILNLCEHCLDSTTFNAPRIICECENVTEPELSWVKKNFDVKLIDDYRRRTRQGMGPCQGLFCYFKIANLEAKWTEKNHAQIMEELKFALNKRWKIETSADEILKRQIKFSKYIYLLGGNLE
ncbi:MAG TPA: FAD-dependent oxidoreductase, partial [Candidatus Lokiarchaeia archaeon]